MGAAASTCPVSPAITIIILIVVALVVGLLLVLLWKRCCRHPAAGEGGGTRGAAPKWGLWVGRGTCFGADGSVFPSRGQQRPGQKVRPSGGESCWGLCSVPASLAAPPGRLGERAGGCGRAKRGSPAAPPPPGAGITTPAGSLQLGSFVFLSPPALPGAAADPDACGEGWGRGQHPQRAPLPGPGAGAAPCRGGSRRPRAGGRAPCPPAWPSSEPFLYLDHAHQLQGFQGRKVSIRGVRLILIPGPQNLLF